MDSSGALVTLALPPLLFLALVLAAATRTGWRDAVLHAFLGLGVFWIITAALLSPAERFDATGIALAHLAMTFPLAWWTWRHRDELPPISRPGRDPWIAVLAAELVVLVVVAVSVAPNNFDSMAYHLPKVEQWLQQGAVGTFPAHFLPQIYLAPLAEIGMAETQLMVGTYWAVNLVQLLAHVVTLVAVSVLARNVGLGVRGQAMAAGIFGLAPLAVAEAVTTQNDYVVTAFAVTAYAVASRPADRSRPWAAAVNVALVGLAIGLAVATKPTVAVLVWPAALWSLQQLRGSDTGRAIVAVGVGIAAAVLVNLSWTTSNLALFESPAGPDVGLLNATHGPSAVVGNAVRNTGYQLATPVGRVNDAVVSVIGGGLGAVGIEPDDPATNYQGLPFSVDSERNEDRPANLLQGLLIAAALIATLVVGRLRRQVGWLAASILVGYLLFGAVFRWQPWGGRLLMPLLALGAVVAAAWLTSWRWRHSSLVGLALLAVLTVQSLPWLLASQWRPLVGSASVLKTSPEDEWFAAQPQLRPLYLNCRDAALQTDREVVVGLTAGVYAWEYPLWPLFVRGGADAEIHNVGVDNASAEEGADVTPTVVFTGGTDDAGVLTFTCGGDDTASP